MIRMSCSETDCDPSMTSTATSARSMAVSENNGNFEYVTSPTGVPPLRAKFLETVVGVVVLI